MVNFQTFMNQKKTEEALRAQNDMLFQEVIKLRAELEKKNNEQDYIYIVKDAQGNAVGYYKERINAMELIEFKQKAVEHLLEHGTWIITPPENTNQFIKEELLHLEVKEFED